MIHHHAGKFVGTLRKKSRRIKGYLDALFPVLRLQGIVEIPQDPVKSLVRLLIGQSAGGCKRMITGGEERRIVTLKSDILPDQAGQIIPDEMEGIMEDPFKTVVEGNDVAMGVKEVAKDPLEEFARTDAARPEKGKTLHRHPGKVAQHFEDGVEFLLPAEIKIVRHHSQTILNVLPPIHHSKPLPPYTGHLGNVS